MVSIAQMMKVLPDGFEQACHSTKAIVRKRGVTNAGDLMLLSMFHLINGCSLLEISEIARITKLGDMSDVAFMKRFEQCGEWFKWIAERMKTSGMANYKKPEYLEPYNVLGIDASDVTEKGRSARTWRLHYALDIFEMSSKSYRITEQKVGESLLNFEFEPGQLVIADRIYTTLNGIRHCLEKEADYILRLRANSFSLYDENGNRASILYYLSDLKDGECTEVTLSAGNLSGERIPVRVCAMRKSAEAIKNTQKRLRRKESKKQLKLSTEAKTLNEYIVVVTSLPCSITAEQILDTYRLRWQVEIQFKRMKSILDFGEIPKRRSASVMTWLNGKLMLALIIERVIATAFFPKEQLAGKKESVARNEVVEINSYYECY